MHSLVEEKNVHVSPGRMTIDPIEKLFCLVRCLSGNHLALDVSSFYQIERTLLLQLVAKLCANQHGSMNKIERKNL